jgi:UDP-3-O-[3-hydroxymyristoyl] N-acetylglucosamine deacetylase
MLRQHTIRKSVSLEGIGLHSGKPVRLAVSPAPSDSGIVFRVGSERVTPRCRKKDCHRKQ